MIGYDVSLKPYTTFGIEALASKYAEVDSLPQLLSMISDGCFRNNPYFILGGGSNVVFTRNFNGLIVRMCNKGIRITEQDGDCLFVEASAGEEWDAFVRHATAMGCHGLESMVAIPGTVGASPVQNVGAYGVEAKDVIHKVNAYDLNTGELRVFSNDECKFGYRDSIFKTKLANRYVVWSVVFKLRAQYSPDLSYKALQNALAERGLECPSPQQLLDIISEIRWSKLPRPEIMGSAGSFFKNPVVSPGLYESLKLRYPDMVAYETPQGYKLAAGWLIDKSGWKGRTMGNAGVYEKQALVLVNRGGCTGNEVLRLADAIVADVHDKFGVSLEKEAIII